MTQREQVVEAFHNLFSKKFQSFVVTDITTQKKYRLYEDHSWLHEKSQSTQPTTNLTNGEEW